MGRPVVQWQLVTRDPQGAAHFYGELFGWETDDDNPMGYRRVDPGGDRGIPGGIWPAPPEATSFFQLFVEVEDVDAAVAKAEELGGSVVIAPQSMPEGDRMAVIHDPEGVPVALYRPPA